MKRSLLVIVLFGVVFSNAQVLIDDTNQSNQTPQDGAILELKSENKGFLLPRMENPTTEMEVEGMVYFDTFEKKFKGFDGTSWIDLSMSGESPKVEELTFTETFNDKELNTSSPNSYTQVDIAGEDETTWSCVAKTNLGSYEIDEKGLMFSKKDENYCDVTFPNGIKTIKFDYRGAFSSGGYRKIDIIKDGQVIGTTREFTKETPATTLEPAILVNETGSVTLRINNAKNTNAVIDNVSWTR